MNDENEEITVFVCNHIGISGTTDVVVRRTAEGYEARVGIALFGMTNMDWADIDRINDPFSPEWRDNYAAGVGATKEEAIEALRRDQAEIAETLWL